MQVLKRLINLFLFIPVAASAQTGNPKGIEAVAADLVKNIRSPTKENIQIQTDKLLYAVTEKVWFKVFILDSVSDKLLASSGTLFIDVVDQLDQPIVKIFQHAAHKESGGSIKLPDSTASGIYWLRAYTKPDNHMRASNISIRPLVIVNSQKTGTMENLQPAPAENNAASTSKLIARIFPEGGHLMAGEDNLVYIKLEDLNGHPLADSGMVKDAQGRMIERFVTNNSGLAKFRFNPTSRGKYNLFVKNGGRYDSVSAMPKVNFYAAQLSITEQNNQSVKFKVLLEDSLFKADYTTYLLGINKDSLCFASVGKGMYEAYLPVNSFPSGIARLMLFNEQGILLSERDILLTQASPRISITTSKDHVALREKVDLDIQMSDAEGKPILATYILSVADNRMTDHRVSFFEDTLLKSPSLETEWMLISNAQSNNNLASTANEISSGLQSSFNPFIYDGTILNKKGKGLANYQISMLSMRPRLLILQDTTELNGGYSFNLPEFSDSLEVEFKVNALLGIEQEYVIRAGQKHFPSVLTPAEKKAAWMSLWSGYQQMISRYEFDTLFAQAHSMLPMVTVTSTAKKEPAKASKSNIITREQLLSYGMQSVDNYILTAQGVHLTTNGYLIIGGVNAFHPSAGDEPLLVMDGSQVNLSSSTDVTSTSPVLAYLKTLNVRQIGTIRILNGAEAAEYGVRGGHGVIEITSASEPETKEIQLNKKYWLEGYLSPKPFPVDAGNGSKGLKQKTTLYWNGDLTTDAQGSNKISFYTSDLVTDYLITIAGISSRGERIYKTVILKM
jgi:hypothetical protein